MMGLILLSSRNKNEEWSYELEIKTTFLKIFMQSLIWNGFINLNSQ